MRTLPTLILVVSSLLRASAEEPPPQAPPELKARIEALEQLANDAPGEAAVLMLLGNAYASAGEKEKAVALLQRIAESRSGLIPPDDQDFFKLKGDPAFEKALAAARAASPGVEKATVAFRVRQPDLVPEGLACDRRTRTLFLGSLYAKKIVAIDRKGRVRDFAAGEDVGASVLGMKVHGDGLWAVTQRLGPTSETKSAVIRLDLRTGRRTATYIPEDKEAELNDLAISDAGDVFVSDSSPSGGVHRIPRDGRTIEPLLPAGGIRFANGIAITPDGATLFLANWRGIWKIDVATKAFARLEHVASISASAIDGLYLDRGALVGIQNWTHPGRVLRFTMNPTRTRLVRQEVLESGHPAREVPTTGAIAGHTFYFIANSQIGRMSRDGTSLTRAVDPETVILQLPL